LQVLVSSEGFSRIFGKNANFKDTRQRPFLQL
jgi:hypothetical protein